MTTIWGPKYIDKVQNFEMFAILCSSFCYLNHSMQEDFRINKTLMYFNLHIYFSLSIISHCTPLNKPV